jgi:4-hydroxy-tetrahydrodipicolinate synthase
LKATIYTPTVTIFNDLGEFDFEGNRKVIEYLIEGGVDGLVPLGSTGEFTTLSLSEKKEFIKFYVETVNERVQVLPGTGCMDYDKTVELSNYALSLGVKGVLIIPPYYYALSQDEGFKYYDKIAENVNGDVYIYNFKARTGFDISPETVLKLAKKNKNIKGMKDSTADIAHTRNVLLKVLPERPDFEIYSGFDDQFIPNVIAGGRGCISAISNIYPKLWSEWVQAVNNNKFDTIQTIGNKIDKLMELYDVQSNFSLLFKKLMVEEGVEINTNTLFPFENIKNDNYEKALRIVKGANNN